MNTEQELLQPLLLEEGEPQAVPEVVQPIRISEQQEEDSQLLQDVQSNQPQQRQRRRLPMFSRAGAWFHNHLANARRDSELLDPYQEAARNFPAAICSGCVLALLAMSSGASDWFYTRGGGCNHVYIGTGAFLANGELLQRTKGESSSLVWRAGEESYVNCINNDIIITVRTVLTLLLVAVVFTVMQLILDLSAPNARLLKVVQFNATGSITTCLVCVTACGLTYWAAELIQGMQEATQLRPNSQVTVALCSGYYLIGAAGLLSILAAAFNCLHQPNHIRRLRQSVASSSSTRQRRYSHRRSQSSRSRRTLWPFRLGGSSRISINSGDILIGNNSAQTQQQQQQQQYSYPDDGLGPPPDDQFDEAQLLLGIADYDPPAYEAEFGEGGGDIAIDNGVVQPALIVTTDSSRLSADN